MKTHLLFFELNGTPAAPEGMRVTKPLTRAVRYWEGDRDTWGTRE